MNVFNNVQKETSTHQGQETSAKGDHATPCIEQPVAAGNICIHDADHMMSLEPPQHDNFLTKTGNLLSDNDEEVANEMCPGDKPINEKKSVESSEPSEDSSRRDTSAHYHPARLNELQNNVSFRRQNRGRRPSMRRIVSSPSFRSLSTTASTVASAIRSRERIATGELVITSRLRKEASAASIAVDDRELSGRVRRTSASIADDSLSPTTTRLILVGAALFTSLALVFSLTYLVLRFALEDPYENYIMVDSHQKRFQKAVRDTIPFVRSWYQDYKKDNDYLLALPNVPYDSTPNSTLCLDRWFTDLETAVPKTDPSMIAFALTNMGLSSSALINDELRDFLEEPQPLNSMYSDSRDCQASNLGVVRNACILLEKSPWNLSNSKERHALEYIVNLAAVQEVLSRALENNPAVLYQVIEIAKNTRQQQLEGFLEQSPVVDSQSKDLFRTTYQGILDGMHALGKAYSGNVVPHQRESLQLNILGAVKLDLLLGHEANARVGLAIAASVSFGPVFEESKLLWRLGSDWVSNYIAWEASLIYGSFDLGKLSKLLIPSVACTAQDVTGEYFVARHIISAGLDIMHQVLPPEAHGTTTAGIDEERANDILSFYSELHSIPSRRFDVASTLGMSNLNHTRLMNPSHATMEEMFSTLCGRTCYDGSWSVTDTSPQSNLGDVQFRVYVGFILWITVLIAGLGMELLVWLTFLRYGWSKKLEDRWKFAQFVFPLFAATTLGLALDHDYLALPFLVLGLWKFGFPETLLYMYMAIYDTGNAAIERTIDFINAVGTVTHHGAASFLITMCLAAVFPPDRHFIDGILILLMQHWFVLLAYVSRVIYILLELVLEAFFEWIVISNMQYLYSLHWTASLSAGAMLVAHWLYLSGAGLELIGKQRDDEANEEKANHSGKRGILVEEGDIEADPQQTQYRTKLEVIHE